MNCARHAGLAAALAFVLALASVPAFCALPAPTAASSTAQVLAAAVDAGKGPLQGCLGSLDGGPLSAALRRAARAHRLLSLVLDSDDASSRAVGRALQALGAQVRWSAGLRAKQRLLLSDAKDAWAWGPGTEPLQTQDFSPVQDRFISAWALSKAALSREIGLRDELKALPDPSEEAPHYTRRAGGSSAP